MHRPVLRLWRYVFLTPILGVFGMMVLWFLGLISFITTILLMSPPPTTRTTDGIVVLTGGAERVKTGLQLLKDHRGRELLISGVHKDTDRGDLLARAGMKPGDVPCCITLGFEAIDTSGNAHETARWARTHHLETLRVVTATYHMPRAYLEMKIALPDIRIVPHPVRPGQFDLWKPSGARLVFKEYHKTILVGARWALRRGRLLFLSPSVSSKRTPL